MRVVGATQTGILLTTNVEVETTPENAAQDAVIEVLIGGELYQVLSGSTACQ